MFVTYHVFCCVSESVLPTYLPKILGKCSTYLLTYLPSWYVCYLPYLLGMFCYLPCVSLRILKVSYLPDLVGYYLPTYLPTLLPTYALIGGYNSSFQN
jgi:hypothetical protein